MADEAKIEFTVEIGEEIHLRVDHSGGKYKVKEITLHTSSPQFKDGVIRIQEKTKFVFKAAPSENIGFTNFRYTRLCSAAELEHPPSDLGTWFAPSGLNVPNDWNSYWPPGAEFKGVRPAGSSQPSLTVTDCYTSASANHTYLFMLEWKEGAETYVSSPTIKIKHLKLSDPLYVYVTPVKRTYLPDPSGGDGLVCEVNLSSLSSLDPPPADKSYVAPPDKLIIKEPTDIVFTSESKYDLFFTDFRYIRSNLKMPEDLNDLGKWWNPGGRWNARWPVHKLPEFVGVSPSGWSPTMTVTDRNTESVIDENYLFIMEFIYEGVKYVSDPKIKQSPSPGHPALEESPKS